MIYKEIYEVFSHAYPTEIGPMLHVSISRLDKKEIVESWSFFQQLKDFFFGENAQAVEIYPKYKDVVNHANIRHFWILPNNYKIPFST